MSDQASATITEIPELAEGFIAIRTSLLRTYPGARHGLRQSTALVGLSYDGAIPDIVQFDRRLAKLLAQISPRGAKDLR
jgi:hypothetical protein